MKLVSSPSQDADEFSLQLVMSQAGSLPGFTLDLKSEQSQNLSTKSYANESVNW